MRGITDIKPSFCRMCTPFPAFLARYRDQGPLLGPAQVARPHDLHTARTTFAKVPAGTLQAGGPTTAPLRAPDGKAGSLVDDRGHFYKPLQRGPRGDREHAFYDAVEAMLRAEAAEAAAAAVAAAAVKQQRQQRSEGGAGSCGGSNGACSPVTRVLSCGEQRPAVSLPWNSSRKLRQLFPSFKDVQRDPGGLMAVTQRDEIGLLSSRALALLRLRRDSLQQPPTAGPGAQQQQQQQQDQQQQQQQQQHDHHQQQQQQNGHGSSNGWASCPAHPDSNGRPGSAGSEADDSAGGEGSTEDLMLQYGKSPDSDDLAEHTGRHLMQTFRDGGGGRGGDGSSCVPSEGAQALQEGAAAGGGAHIKQQQRQQQRQHCPQAAAVGKQRPAAAECGGRIGLPFQEQQQPPPPLQPQQQPRLWGQHGHSASISVEEAYTQPEHAQVAALLGQPVYDASLSAAAPSSLVVHSASKPYRSPFMSELLHHSHPPGPQERFSPAAPQPTAPPSAGGSATASLLSACVSACTTPRASSAACWLSDESDKEEEKEGLEGEEEEEGHGMLAGQCCGSPTSDCAAQHSALGSLPFSVRNAPLLRVIPKYYGVTLHSDGRTLLELEDLARAYLHPCIMDIKIGFRTWYPAADAKYIQRCKDKDESTTQAALGFKICGMQVFRHGAGGYWRASKRWCKTLPVELVDKALLSFAHNECGLRPSDVYGGPAGAIAQLEALESWFAVQRDFHFYSSSVLVLYEGGAATPEGAKVRVRLVDFAHTFHQGKLAAPGRRGGMETSVSAAAEQGVQEGRSGSAAEGPGTGGGAGGAGGGGSVPPAPVPPPPRACPRRDTNFLAGLRALLARLRSVVHAQLQAELT